MQGSPAVARQIAYARARALELYPFQRAFLSGFAVNADVGNATDEGEGSAADAGDGFA